MRILLSTRRLIAIAGLALLLPGTTLAQFGDSLRAQLDSAFRYLDLSQAPTGYLAEYGYAYTSLRPFNGQPSDSNVITRDLFGFVYQSVRTARIGGATELPPVAQVQDRLTGLAGKQNLYLGVIAGRMDFIRLDAFSLNLLTLIDSLPHDVPGRSQSPYETQPFLLPIPQARTLMAG